MPETAYISFGTDEEELHRDRHEIARKRDQQGNVFCYLFACFSIC